MSHATFLAVQFLTVRIFKLKFLEKLEMNSSEQEAMMESDEDEQMDNDPQNGIDEDLDSSQGKVSNCFLTTLVCRFLPRLIDETLKS